MNDYMKAFVIFLILILIAWFVLGKGRGGTKFKKWLFVTTVGGMTAFGVVLLFLQFVHFENPVLKQMMTFLVMAITAPVSGKIAAIIYNKRGGSSPVQ